MSSNEIGWRGWLFGQFILLVWAVDLIFDFPFDVNDVNSIKFLINKLTLSKDKLVKLMTIFAVVGILTSIVDLSKNMAHYG